MDNHGNTFSGQEQHIVELTPTFTAEQYPIRLVPLKSGR